MSAAWGSGGRGSGTANDILLVLDGTRTRTDAHGRDGAPRPLSSVVRPLSRVPCDLTDMSLGV